MAHVYAPDSGTKDKNYDLITVTQLCLEHVWRLEQYARDAERAGDEELVWLFRRMQHHSRRGADECERLLGRRMGEETGRKGSGAERGYGRGAYGMEQGPYGLPTSWESQTPFIEDAGRSGRPMGRFSGQGPKGYTRSKERIVESVCDRLTDHPDLDASQIQVDARDDVVLLRGRVHDRGQKRLAEDIADSVSGIRDVRNELDVDKGMFEELTDAITGRSEEATRAKKRTRPRASV